VRNSCLIGIRRCKMRGAYLVRSSQGAPEADITPELGNWKPPHGRAANQNAANFSYAPRHSSPGLSFHTGENPPRLRNGALNLHGYAGRESIEHTLYEQISWFEKWVKNPPQKKTSLEQPGSQIAQGLVYDSPRAGGSLLA